jgi:D-alanyl-D-alanine dipeptidase
VTTRSGPLPDYAWAGSTPEDAGIAPEQRFAGLPPVQPHRPESLPPAPDPVPGDLVPIHDARIRALAAYWHEGWAHAHPTALLRPEAAARLVAAARSLPDGFGLAVWDAWRAPALQKTLFDTYYADPDLPPGYVSEPSPDPALCPPHASGGTVDLTLTWRHTPLQLGTPFDAFRPEAWADSFEPDGPQPVRDLRRLLAAAMGSAGFVVLQTEWWHWEFGTRLWASATGQPVRFGRTSPP